MAIKKVSSARIEEGTSRRIFAGIPYKDPRSGRCRDLKYTRGRESVFLYSPDNSIRRRKEDIASDEPWERSYDVSRFFGKPSVIGRNFAIVRGLLKIILKQREESRNCLEI